MRRTRVGFRPGISRTVEGCIVISGDMTSLELGVVAPVGGHRGIPARSWLALDNWHSPFAMAC